jgi:hypothetical protein
MLRACESPSSKNGQEGAREKALSGPFGIGLFRQGFGALMFRSSCYWIGE